MVTPIEKEKISIRLDKDVLDFLKKNGRGYQSVINSILRTYYEAHRQ
ncbi:MAG TPA: BrnA antitoxin family protein [Spirochaetota bacterium]|nr:BrnA antitoxin family protein [Spirochaetota bacterium]